MKVALYLMSKKGYKVLSALIENGYKAMISAVIYSTDKNVENDYADEIIQLCKECKIDFFDRKNNKVIIADYFIAISWRWLIEKENSSLIVIHDSLLPKYRGFAPLVNMLINKEKFIGVTALFATKEYDKGDMIYQSKTAIEYPIRINEAIDIIVNNYIDVVLKIFSTLMQGTILPRNPQNETQASYSLWRDEDDYHIDWNKDAYCILDFINAVSYPYKGAYSYVDNKKIRILEAEIKMDVCIENRDCGKVIFIEKGYPVVVCKTGLLKLKNVVYDDNYIEAIPFSKFRLKFT